MPKFKPGDAVYYTTNKSYGTVVVCLNLKDKRDILVQGYRYIVKLGSWDWSIPEHKLRKDGRKQ